jgi:FKBP-type peptidyl-prolyl cis-trans isomerase FkpA
LLKKLVLISFLITLFFSCENKFPDYIDKGNGIYLKILSFDNDEKKFEEGIYSRADITIKSSGKVIYKHYTSNIIEPDNKDFNQLFSFLNEGDSASFMITPSNIGNKYLGNSKTEYLEVLIKIHQYYTQEEYLLIQQKEDEEMNEQLLLVNYLKEFNLSEKDIRNGIYVKKLQKGEGKKIKNGDLISISYKGSFINRLEFDNNYKDSVFTFTYGTPGQVIKGLEIALNGMRKGEKSKIIIPSQLAFGEEGSSTQIIPPFTTVVYELEIINVK